MNRKDLETKFKLIGQNDDICLYRKEKVAEGIGYCGNISLVRGKAVFNGNSYDSVDSLEAALTEWGNSLEWPVDTYNPMLNDKWRLESRLIWYLEEKLGFKPALKGWNRSYVREIGPDYALSFSIDTHKDETYVSSKFGTLNYQTPVKDAETGVAVIASIVRTSILQMAKDMVDTLSVLPDTDAVDIDLFMESKRSFFGYEKVDFKSVMINLLEEELKKLKGE